MIEFGHPGDARDQDERLIEDLGPGPAVRMLLDRVEDLTWEQKSDQQRRNLMEASRLEALDEAKKLRADAEFRAEPQPDGWNVAELLKRVIPPVQWAVQGLVGENANVLVIAPRKFGKTSLLLDYIRTRLDGGLMFGRFESAPLEGKIALWDLEMDLDQIQRWIEARPPENSASFELLPLRGFDGSLISESFEAWAVDWLKARGVVEWVIDPFGRIMGTLDENDASDMKMICAAINRIKRKAGVKRVIIAVHAGKNADGGARGSSAIEGWPDAFITVGRDTKNPAQRNFKAEGRDVLVELEDLDYNFTDRSFKLSGAAWTKQVGPDDLYQIIADAGPGGIAKMEVREKLYRLLRVNNQLGDQLRDGLISTNRLVVTKVGKTEFLTASVPLSTQQQFGHPD